MASEIPFDRLSERFGRNIYDSPKGQLRLRLLQQDLTPYLTPKPLNILDAGGGQGQFARWCADQGHRLTLCDQSQSMLEQARKAIEQDGTQAQFDLVHCDIETYCQQQQATFDLILCHAVLEWVEHPQPLLAALHARLKFGGRLSLMFYNRHSLVLRNALRGNFRKALSDNLAGDGSGLTPLHCCDPRQVEQILVELGFEIEFCAGVRCFYDYLPPKVRQTYAFEDIVEIEQRFRQQPPYSEMARYIHLIARRPD